MRNYDELLRLNRSHIDVAIMRTLDAQTVAITSMKYGRMCQTIFDGIRRINSTRFQRSVDYYFLIVFVDFVVLLEKVKGKVQKVGGRGGMWVANEFEKSGVIPYHFSRVFNR